ncbi:hypothetical protein [Microbacterium sp. MRS-1]|uniref:hypothetical protein n=1 Tax=Microbacterium sp. MRS-1 TaxID=1451261 RepID=UPI00044EB957|nr:hypothetical protein [Microbacterium sp. MRS-1]EXJ52009.1 hypothetical protein AS96_06655 [Microbacterium sp. MRS-1]
MSRARALASAVAIVLAVVCLPLSILSVWARVQLVDEDAFTATLVPLARSTTVQDALIAASADAVDARLDADALTGSIVDGIIGLGVGDRAADALRRLQAPAAAAVQTLVHDTIADAIRSDGFGSLWEQLLRQSHRALTLAATSDGAGVVVQTEAGLGIQVGAVVAGVKERLSAQGVAWATLIPSVDHVVVIGSGDTLAAVRTGYALGVTVGWWMPVATVILFLSGIALARRRLNALAAGRTRGGGVPRGAADRGCRGAGGGVVRRSRDGADAGRGRRRLRPAAGGGGRRDRRSSGDRSRRRRRRVARRSVRARGGSSPRVESLGSSPRGGGRVLRLSGRRQGLASEISSAARSTPRTVSWLLKA